MFKSASTSLIVLGILAILAGVIALAWPGITILALVVLFAIYAFSDALAQAMRAFSGDKAGPVAGHLLLALVDFAAGAAAIAWPSPTALVLVFVAASWAIVTGVIEFSGAFAAGERPGTRALFLLGGLVSTAFGVVLFARPGVGVVTLALMYGLFALCYGITQIAAGVQLRGISQDAGEVLGHAA
jgi:uncharacterized membrane protein HdeD (DUF308 family)